MVKTVDYESRKKAVLSAAINRYIKKPLPVSSEDLVKEFSLSSATIRNIFADLETEGYLAHPYTSGGRVPTNKGYRYYVDFLLSQLELLDEEKNSIQKQCNREFKHFEDMLEKTSGAISQITHCTTIISFSEWQDKFLYSGVSFILEQPEFRDIKQLQFLIKMLEDKQRLLNIINRDFSEKVRIYIGEELGCREMDNCALAISNYTVKNRIKGKLAVLGPMRMEYGHIIPALEYTADVLSDLLEGY